MERLAAVCVLLPVEVFVGFQARIVGVAELSGLLIWDGIARLRTSTTGRVVI
jgi:hypothetical protein